MADASHALDQIQQQLNTLLQRVELLEHRLPAAGAETQPAESPAHGFLTYDGSIELGGKQLKMRSRRPATAAFSADAESVARIFGALGSPHRILMVRALCDGPKTGQQLEESAGISSTGQLYHHLKELLAAGLVTQPARSLYALRPASIIALCVALMLASDLAAPPAGASTTPVADQAEPWPEDI
jgi:ArsR family transcriptional regulator, arsenate/arsenite/antimonite-responsive transcriptional repressor